MAVSPTLCKALEYLIDRWGLIESRTRLIKLIYLADLEWAGTHSGPYTEAKYYRWNHGPFSREVLTDRAPLRRGTTHPVTIPAPVVSGMHHSVFRENAR
jgi:Protein of unknown function (DUF4065)